MAKLNIIVPFAALLVLLTFYFAFHDSNDLLSHIADKASAHKSALTSSSSSSDTENPSWFIGISSADHLPGRRQMLRSTWQSLYANSSTFTARFIIGTPAPEWVPVIQQENATYGDIIILDKGADDREFATTIKPFEMLKWVRDQTGGKHWNYVSKIDDDTMLNARQFYEEWILPEPDRKRAIIGRSIRYARPHDFPSGSFYTLTGDLAILVANLFEGNEQGLIDIMNEVTHNKVKKRGLKEKRHEDFMMADILVINKEEYELLPLSYDVAFNLDDPGKSLSDKTIMVHNLKKDEDYMGYARKFAELEEKRLAGLSR